MKTIKTALVTGGTDGIGRSVAIELARKGYAIHVLGRSTIKGKDVIDILKEENPEGEHRLYITDLSTVKEVKTFLNSYIKKNSELDILVLNAGIYPKKISLSEDGIDLSFSVGYISRYLFSVMLNPLLNKSTDRLVAHICGSAIGNIKYEQLKSPNYSNIHSVWQNSVGSAYLAFHWKNISKTKVKHIHWNPGIVNTQTVKSQSWIVRKISKLMGMVSPERAASIIVEVLTSKNISNLEGSFYFKGKPQNVKNKIAKRDSKLHELLEFSRKFTGV